MNIYKSFITNDSMRQKLSQEKKIFAIPLCLPGEQIKWLNKNKQFSINKFVRNKLSEYIDLTIKIKNYEKTIK
jgi:hypothetical protein